MNCRGRGRSVLWPYHLFDGRRLYTHPRFLRLWLELSLDGGDFVEAEFLKVSENEAVVQIRR